MTARLIFYEGNKSIVQEFTGNEKEIKAKVEGTIDYARLAGMQFTLIIHYDSMQPVRLISLN